MTPDPARTFEALRPRLFGIAYRMLGVVADAEEVVQEAFARRHTAGAHTAGAHEAASRAGDGSGPAAPRSEEAWLVAVTTRLAVDRLRRAAVERAAYAGQWLPEPLPAPPPDRDAELADDLSLAFLLLLERLAPEERAAFLLREAFGADYAEVARAVGKSEVACRQLVHRARERVRREARATPYGRRRFAAAAEVRARVAHRFVEALRAEDRDAVLALLSDDAVLVADGGGRMPAVADVQRGAARVAQLLVAFERMGRTQLERRGAPAAAYEVGWLNGEPAVFSLIGDKILSATVLHLDGEPGGEPRIAGLSRVLNPAKLAGLGHATVLAPGQSYRDLL